MIRPPTKISTNRVPLSKKLLLGFAGASAVAIVGSAGIAAAAQPTTSGNSMPDKVALCKQKFHELGFKNVGQCVSFFAHQKHGYGGNGSNNTVNTDVNVNVKGNDNVIDLAINYIFG